MARQDKKAYELTAAEQRDLMAQSLPLFRDPKPERMYSSKLQVPYHEGAAAYYREKGIAQVQ
jgi:TRAP-type uncharacterized transport system substrate-binding protein